MKKIIMGVMVLFVSVLMITGCGNRSSNSDYKNEQKEAFRYIDYTIPEKFHEEDDKSFAAKYSYDENEMDCSIVIKSLDKATNNAITIDSMVNDFDESLAPGYKVTKKEEIELNGLNATHIQTETESADTFYFTQREDLYYIENDKYIYTVSYSVSDAKKWNREDLDSHVCMTSLNPFINSIKLK